MIFRCMSYCLNTVSTLFIIFKCVVHTIFHNMFTLHVYCSKHIYGRVATYRIRSLAPSRDLCGTRDQICGAKQMHFYLATRICLLVPIRFYLAPRLKFQVPSKPSPVIFPFLTISRPHLIRPMANNLPTPPADLYSLYLMWGISYVCHSYVRFVLILFTHCSWFSNVCSI